MNPSLVILANKPHVQGRESCKLTRVRRVCKTSRMGPDLCPPDLRLHFPEDTAPSPVTFPRWGRVHIK